MFCRISLPVLRCSSFWAESSTVFKSIPPTNYGRSKCLVSVPSKSIPSFISVSSYHCSLKMSFSIESISQESHKKDTVYPHIYLLSRIKQLSLAIKSLSGDICGGLVIKDIDLPVDSDILNPSNVEQLVDAEVVVIDSNILALNYKNMPKLKWAHCTWAGVECLFEIIREKPQFLITRHGEEGFSEQIAEYVMGQILNFEKNFRGIWAAQVDKSWTKMQQCISDCLPNRHLRELTVGVLGVGNMGQAIAKFFKPHGTRMIGLSRRVRNPNEFGVFDEIESSLVSVLAISDYIVNTLPSTPETVGLLNGDVLKECAKKPVFINVGRGNIINEDTLVRALENNWLSHAALDVFEKEPLPADSKLWNLSKQVTITPHYAAISLPKYIAKDFLTSLLCYQQKSPMKNVIDWEKGY